MTKKILTATTVAAVMAIAVPAYAWTPVIDDIKKVGKDIEKGAKIAGCAVIGGAVAGPAGAVIAAGACAND